MFWKANNDIKTYIYPIVKITVSILLTVICMLPTIFNDIFVIPSAVLDFLFRLFRVILFLSCVLCIYISCAECLLLSERREIEKLKERASSCKTRTYPLEEILKLVKEQDLIRIHILTEQNTIIEIGTSSDQKIGSSAFFNKRYVIDQTEYDSIEVFAYTLREQVPHNTVKVVMIDGVTVTYE